MKLAISARRVADPNCAGTYFPHECWNLYEFLIPYQSDGFHAHEVVIYVSPIMSTIV